MLKIAVDAMGGDYAPQEIVAGAALAARDIEGEIILVGQRPVLEAELQRQELEMANIRLHHAEEVVGMDESPRLALRQKVNSSITVCVDLVRTGEAQAAVSAGNSGAFMAAATMRLGTLPGVQRPAIAVLMPTTIGKRIVLDAGANVDCRPEHLADFALMGSLYAQHALGIEHPRVGLLSIGTESSKGNDLTQQALPLLQRLPIHFIGNVEGNQIMTGEVDVTVCDGFVGNVVLKVAEGAARWIMDDLKQLFRSGGWRCYLGAWLMRPIWRRAAQRYDYAEYGGALLLGANGVCIVAHGRSNRRAIAKAISVAVQSLQTRVQEHMWECFSRLHGTLSTMPPQ